MIIARMTVVLTLALTACLSFPTSHDEVSRVSSPAGDLDAVLVETNGGATTSFGYLVYVLPRGAKPSKNHEVAWLYAAGRNAVGLCSNIYVSGLSYADCVFSGRTVARHVASLTQSGDASAQRASK